MNEKQMWERIESLGWGMGADHEPRIKITATWPDKEDVHTFVYRRIDALDRAMQKAGLWIPSDDGRSDVYAHIVGLGRAAYKAALANPQGMLERFYANDCEESFLYCFHDDDGQLALVE